MREVVVRSERRGRIAIVTIDNPPVNALSTTVRRQLLDALAVAAVDRKIEALILAGAGRMFVAGAELAEMDRPPEDPILPSLVNAIDAFPKPTAAAVHGAALGGGLELALAAQLRIAAPATKLGFPEVNIGLVPGSMGTQRMMRAIGFEHTAKLVTSGKPIAAEEAQLHGLVHKIDKCPIEAAIQALEDVLLGAAPPVALSMKQPPGLGGFDVNAFRERLRSSSKGRQAPIAALNLLAETADLPFSKGAARERELFLSLRRSHESRALRHVFTAERRVGRSDDLKGVLARPLSTLGVVGGGLMGCGIAFAALSAGLRARVLETSIAAKAAADKRLEDLFSRSLLGGRLNAEQVTRLKANLSVSVEPSDFRDTNFVIEAVFEDADVKKQVLAMLDGVVSDMCVLASNTSYLDLNELARATKDPRRFIGMHFFSPAHIMRLVEVVRYSETSKSVVATALALARTMGKMPILTGVCEGYCANRILKRWRMEAEGLVEDGAEPQEVDGAMTDYGLSMGPFAIQDLAGLEIALANRRRRPARRSDGRPLDLIERLTAVGRTGAKAKRGWYDYPDAVTTPVPSAEVDSIIAQAAREKGINRRSFSREELLKRQLDAIRTEADAVLRDGIVTNPDDIDLVMIYGFGFPAHRGGPIFDTQLRSASD